MKKPELLSPAGTLKNMRYAFAYGADAVYAGQPRYSLRVRNNEFSKEDVLARGIEEAHAGGKLFFLASNLSPHNNKVRTYLADLEPIIEMAPDALIMSDPGLIMMVRERWPDMPIHLSVQSNAVNFATVNFWKGLGLKRVILSRELSLKEVAEIRAECPDIELEVFVHGALCIAYSGRCLLSGYMSHRDSNQGACTNTCRWKYNTVEALETGTGDIVPAITIDHLPSSPEEKDLPVFLLEEETRPGELMPAFEDEHGASRSDIQQFVGDIVGNENGWLTVDVKNRFETGDHMELVTPSGNLSFNLAAITGRDGSAVNIAPGSGHVVKMPIPEQVDPSIIDEFALLVRYLPAAPFTQ
jgi:putative protease